MLTVKKKGKKLIHTIQICLLCVMILKGCKRCGLLNLLPCRKLWVSSIEDVKKKLEEAEITDEEGDDALNPFYKQGESHKGAGRKKVVSLNHESIFDSILTF